MPLIQCGNHKYAPACIICHHINRGVATEAIRVPAQPGGQSDYLCPLCVIHPWSLSDEEICGVCIHCARILLTKLKIIELEDFSHPSDKDIIDINYDDLKEGFTYDE